MRLKFFYLCYCFFFIANVNSNALDKNRVKIQKELGRQLTTKFIPKIQFEIDTSFENADKLNELIYKANEK